MYWNVKQISKGNKPRCASPFNRKDHFISLYQTVGSFPSLAPSSHGNQGYTCFLSLFSQINFPLLYKGSELWGQRKKCIPPSNPFHEDTGLSLHVAGRGLVFYQNLCVCGKRQPQNLPSPLGTRVHHKLAAGDRGARLTDAWPMGTFCFIMLCKRNLFYKLTVIPAKPATISTSFSTDLSHLRLASWHGKDSNYHLLR